MLKSEARIAGLLASTKLTTSPSESAFCALMLPANPHNANKISSRFISQVINRTVIECLDSQSIARYVQDLGAMRPSAFPAVVRSNEADTDCPLMATVMMAFLKAFVWSSVVTNC